MLYIWKKKNNNTNSWPHCIVTQFYILLSFTPSFLSNTNAMAHGSQSVRPSVRPGRPSCITAVKQTKSRNPIESRYYFLCFYSVTPTHPTVHNPACPSNRVISFLFLSHLNIQSSSVHILSSSIFTQVWPSGRRDKVFSLPSVPGFQTYPKMTKQSSSVGIQATVSSFLLLLLDSN